VLVCLVISLSSTKSCVSYFLPSPSQTKKHMAGLRDILYHGIFFNRTIFQRSDYYCHGISGNTVHLCCGYFAGFSSPQETMVCNCQETGHGSRCKGQSFLYFIWKKCYKNVATLLVHAMIHSSLCKNITNIESSPRDIRK